MSITSAILISLCVLVTPMPRPWHSVFGAALSDRRDAWYWSTAAVLLVLNMMTEWHYPTSLGNIPTIILCLFMLYRIWRRTRRGKRVSMLIGEKARMTRDALVQVQRDTERRLRHALPRVLPQGA